MKKISFLLLALLIIACGQDKAHDLTVRVNIKELKKGTVYLKKIKDTVLTTVDSIAINGNPQFELYSDLESPEVYFLYLDKNSKEEDRITFFADKGITEINTTLKNFVFDAKIKGSKQQKVLEEYNLIMTRFKDRNLELIKSSFEARKESDTLKYDSIQNEFDKLLKRRYLSTINFALNNKDSEVAPYLALTEVYNAKIHLLDTINNSLTENIKASIYGKKLQTFIDDIKSSEE